MLLAVRRSLLSRWPPGAWVSSPGRTGLLSLAVVGGVFATALCGCQASHVVGDVTPPARCPPFRAGADLPLCTASYLGGQSSDLGAVAFAADGALVVGTATAPGSLPQAPPKQPGLGTGNGALHRFDGSGHRLLSTLQMGDGIRDLDVAPTGAIVVVGEPFGVALVSRDGLSVVWTAAFAADRVAIAPSGAVAALATATSTVRIFGPDGSLRGEFTTRLPPGQGDVAIGDSPEAVFVVGARPAGTPSVPVLDAHRLDGSVLWQAYGFTGEALAANNLGASSTGIAVVFGRDGKLYYLGESQGGNTVHGREPGDLGKPAPVVGSGDRYLTPFNTSRFVGFVGRFRAADGTLEAGQFLVPREPGDSGNPAGVDLRPRALAVDAEGRVLVGGTQACCGPEGTQKLLAGQSVAPAAEGVDGVAILLAPDLARTEVWTTFGTGGGSAAVAVALGPQRAALLALQTLAQQQAAPLVTHEALAPGPAGTPWATYFSVWPTPSR